MSAIAMRRPGRPTRRSSRWIDDRTASVHAWPRSTPARSQHATATLWWGSRHRVMTSPGVRPPARGTAAISPVRRSVGLRRPDRTGQFGEFDVIADHPAMSPSWLTTAAVRRPGEYQLLAVPQMCLR